MHHVAFDLGNVLIEVDMTPFWKTVGDLGIRTEDMERLLKLYERNEFCGNIDMYDVFLDELDNEDEAKALLDSWCVGCKPDDQMFNFVSSLRHEGFKIAFLSNIGNTHGEYLRKTFPDFMSFASVQHMSYEVGAAKPCKLYYQSFLMQNEDFAGCTYLDDLHENVKAGATCKFDSLHFDLKLLKAQKPSVLKQELNRIKERLLRGC